MANTRKPFVKRFVAVKINGKNHYGVRGMEEKMKNQRKDIRYNGSIIFHRYSTSRFLNSAVKKKKKRKKPIIIL